MEFDLGRVDYLNVGVTYPNAMKLLPSPKGQERIVIGDQDGVLQIISVKNEDIQVLFKTLPGKCVTCVQIGGSPGTVPDKIFAAFQNEVRGYTKKGKLFLALEVSATESITALFVSGSDLIVACGRNVIHYRDLQEVTNLDCEEPILDLVAVRGSNGGRLMTVVSAGCGRLLVVEHGRVAARSATAAGAAAAAAPRRLAALAGAARVFYGADDGSVGEVELARDAADAAGSPRRRRLADGAGFGRALALQALRRASRISLLVGREDGSLQIYTLNDGASQLSLAFSYACGESLTAVEQCTFDISGEGVEEAESSGRAVWATTYGGRVFAMRPRAEATAASAAAAARRLLPRGAEAGADALVARRDKLRAEVAAAEASVDKQRAAYRATTRAASLQRGFSVPPLLPLRDELRSGDADGWHTLALDAGGPLDTVLLQCDEAIEVRADGAAVRSACAGGRVAALRCQADGGRLSVRLRRAAPPRRAAALTALLVPAGAPRVARLRRYALPPLADYALDADAAAAPPAAAAATARGAFSAAEVASWLATALPPPAPRPSARPVRLRRWSALTDTNLAITFKKGEISIESDNPSSVLILKEHLSTEATKRKVNLNIVYNVDENLTIDTFIKFHSRIKEKFEKRQAHLLKTALSDLINQKELEDDCLCEDYKNILSQTTTSDNEIDLILEVVVDMFTDTLTLKGKQFKQKSLEFKEILKNNVLDDIVSYLKEHFFDKQPEE